MRFKRFIATALTLVIMFSCGNITAYATSKVKYDSLDAIEENLDYFKTITSGNISAVNENGTWYYKFTRHGNTTVQIKASAFMTTPTNGYLNSDNSALTNSCNDNYSRICYYNNMSTSERSYITGPAGRSSFRTSTYKVYTTSMYRFSLEVQGLTYDKVTLKCKLTHGVTFTYSSKISSYRNGYTSDTSGYSTPSTAAGYLWALNRSSVTPVVPTVTLAVDNTGSNNVCLSSYTLCGVGDSSTSLNVNSFVSVAKATKGIIKAAVTSNPVGAFVSLVEILGNAKNLLTKKSNQYNTGESFSLTKKGENPTLKVKYKSPIKLSRTDDWVQVTTDLKSSKYGSKKDATFKINFSFSVA